VQECLHRLLRTRIDFDPFGAAVPGPEHTLLAKVGVNGFRLGGVSRNGSNFEIWQCVVEGLPAFIAAVVTPYAQARTGEVGGAVRSLCQRRGLSTRIRWRQGNLGGSVAINGEQAAIPQYEKST